nr:VacJ family lipoprotein [uncultured Caldimonas sp.]
MKRLAAAALLGAMLAGCASNPRDPLEPVNRKVYAFNDAVDRAVVKPVATVYRDTMPQPVRTGVTHFFSNIGDAWSAINAFLQLKAEAGMRNTMRFGMNTLFGLGGLLDIASEAGIESHQEDFGQTLAHWGVGSGPYLVLPLLGPSTLRDTSALPLDMKASGYFFQNDPQTALGLSGLRLIDARARALAVSNMLGDAALDPYLFVRDAYLQRRRNQVYDGNPPEEPSRGSEWDEEGTEPQAAAAPQ